MLLRRHDVTGVRSWGLISTLAFVVALCLASPLWAAAPPPPEPPAPPEHRATLEMIRHAVGAGSAPQTGAFGIFGTLFAGKHPRWDAWNAGLPLENKYARITLGALTVAAIGASPPGLDSALCELAILLVAEYAQCWKLRDTDVFVPLPHQYLAFIEDGPVGGPGGNEAIAYSAFLRFAHFLSDKAFESAVRHDVTSVHLLESPERYRGEVVRVTGHLLRINRYDPPWEADAAGVRDLYEAWIFAEQFGNQPYCVIFTNWPEGLTREALGQQRLVLPPRVSADGFFFKRLHYAANGPTKERVAPMIFAHTIRLDQAPRPFDPGPRWLNVIVIALVSGVGLILTTVVGLSWWWRRNDEKTRKRLLAARTPEFIMPPPDPTPAMPVAPPVHKTTEPAPRFSFPPGLGDRPAGESGPPGKSGDRGSEDEPPEEAGA